MDAYRQIKVIIDCLLTINNPCTDQELVQCTLFGLDHDYKSLITIAAYFGGDMTLDDLRSKFISYELHVIHLCEHPSSLIMHHALVMRSSF